MHKDRFDSVPGHHKIKHLREIVSVFFVPMSQLGVSYFYCTTVTPIVLLPSKHTPSINNPLTDTAKYFGDGWWEMPSNHCPPHRRVTVASSADRQHAQALVCLAAETRSQGLRIQDSKELYSQLVSLHGRSGHAYSFNHVTHLLSWFGFIDFFLFHGTLLSFYAKNKKHKEFDLGTRAVIF